MCISSHNQVLCLWSAVRPPTGHSRWLPVHEPGSAGGFFRFLHCHQVIAHRVSQYCSPYDTIWSTEGTVVVIGTI